MSKHCRLIRYIFCFPKLKWLLLVINYLFIVLNYTDFLMVYKTFLIIFITLDWPRTEKVGETLLRPYIMCHVVEWMSEWVSEWVRERVSEWVSDICWSPVYTNWSRINKVVIRLIIVIIFMRGVEIDISIWFEILMYDYSMNCTTRGPIYYQLIVQ